MITKTQILPPLFLQYFSNKLLYTPLPCDNADRLMRIYHYIVKKLIPKNKNNPKRKELCDRLILEFMELYERAKVKEENLKGKTENKAQRFFYRIEGLDKCYQNIFDGLRYK